MFRNGTILLQKPNWQLGKNLTDRVIKTIQFITQSKYHHVIIYLNGHVWESSVWHDENGKFCHGVKKSDTIPYYDTALEPVNPLTQEEIDNLEQYFEKEKGERSPYNFLKLFILSIVYPTRWFWKLIKWVPFSNDIFGEVCSTFIDEAYALIGRDILPDDFHGYTAPVDFLRTIEANTFQQVVK